MAQPSITIEAARRGDWQRALELLLRHVEPELRRHRLAAIVDLLTRGEIPAAGLFVARQATRLVGAVFCIPLPGGSVLFWPPAGQAAEALVAHALDFQRRGGARLAQALIAPEEMPLAASLLKAGFRHATHLHYLRHDLHTVPSVPSPQLDIQILNSAKESLFVETLRRTYQGTLDCPELNGQRTMAEVLEGHRGQGIYRPDLWWLAYEAGRPVAVVLLAELHAGEGWDLSYLGVVPEARGRGVGRALAARTIAAAKEARQPQLILAVDARNTPARQLYAKTGFQEGEGREVLLFFFGNLAAAAERGSRTTPDATQ